MSIKAKILLVDDEPDILEFIGFNLINQGYKIEKAINGKEALQKVKLFMPDLILMDVMMPEMDGITACGEIRSMQLENNPIIALLTARGEDYSQIAGFEAGADDYITKPISPKVLISRIKALLKRKKKSETITNTSATLHFTNLTIDLEKHTVLVYDKEVVLPKKEFKLLILLASKPDRVFSRNEIYNAIWGNDTIVGDRTIDVHIRKLREKVGSNYIKTIKGIGYKFSSTLS